MILPLEKQVCSLELAKKLKELGVRQESLWVWAKFGPFGNEWDIALSESMVGSKKKELYSAFTVAELSELLPDDYYSFRSKNKWYTETFDDDVCEVSFNHANSKAKMLIHLIKEGVVDV